MLLIGINYRKAEKTYTCRIETETINKWTSIYLPQPDFTQTHRKKKFWRVATKPYITWDFPGGQKKCLHRSCSYMNCQRHFFSVLQKCRNWNWQEKQRMWCRMRNILSICFRQFLMQSGQNILTVSGLPEYFCSWSRFFRGKFQAIKAVWNCISQSRTRSCMYRRGSFCIW